MTSTTIAAIIDLAWRSRQVRKLAVFNITMPPKLLTSVDCSKKGFKVQAKVNPPQQARGDALPGAMVNPLTANLPSIGVYPVTRLV